MFRSNASEFGLGGYNILSGNAWHWEIPIELRFRTSINSLEFIACVVSIWIEKLHGSIKTEILTNVSGGRDTAQTPT